MVTENGMIEVSAMGLQIIRNQFNLVEPETVIGEGLVTEYFFDEGHEEVLAKVEYIADGAVRFYVKDGIMG